MAKRKSNRLLYILGAIALLLITGLAVAKKQGWIGKPNGVEVTVAKAKQTKIIEKVSASGKVQPEVEVKISPDVSGEITELHVKEGDSVVKGQLLLRIRADNYKSMVEAQQARVNTERANLAQAKAQLSQLIASSTNIRLTHERNVELFKQKVISQADFDQSKAQYEASLQEIESTRQRVRASEFNLKSAQASLNDANENLRKTTIYAPVSGTISKLSVERGERVVGTSQMAGTEMLRIANLNSMEVRVNVNENDIIRVGLGDSAIVEVDSYSNDDTKFRGVVTAIANTAKDATTLEAVTEFEVRIRLLSDSYNNLKKKHATPFRPGMTASVDIITEQKDNVLSVPLAAVTTRNENGEGTNNSAPPANQQNQNQDNANNKAKSDAANDKLKEVIFVQENGKAKMVEVKTGISDFDNIEITSGLKPGQEVISGPFRAVTSQLKNGTAVIVKDEKSLNKTGGDEKEGNS
ncbi:efflux RND transporter periplasmic adaptor subunit [Adhaeribacter swui]|uniref:Efflux RND transporter periplasmic adaptor subunit n=1 Tax=Adhaeribacter swui TaxID=2086471 RepID=A0A7G7GDA2_9BACT|nr:efflux RND transporter periplasmic adaptor subunit [Adhaeribacter swui]QNF35136.1 efflux RND transporter periplasmic adaptor subunit [Adhaeribacter swui]